jgi:hypothetical protein
MIEFGLPYLDEGVFCDERVLFVSAWGEWYQHILPKIACLCPPANGKFYLYELMVSDLAELCNAVRFAFVQWQVCGTNVQEVVWQ